jgi:hypothetical protein
LDPQNRYVETVIKDYVGSVISSVKKKVYTYDLYQYVKPRLTADADDLRTTILVCVLEMFHGNSFRMFLNKLLQDNDILKQPKDTNTSTTQEASDSDNDLIANDVIFKMFLHKLTDDLSKPANKFNAEVIGKYVNLISGISSPKDTENEIAKAFVRIPERGVSEAESVGVRGLSGDGLPSKDKHANVRKTGGGHNVTHKVWNRHLPARINSLRQIIKRLPLRFRRSSQTHIKYKSTPTTRKNLRVHKNKYSSTKRTIPIR